MLTTACKSFLSSLEEETVLGQAHIRRTGSALELRHVRDRDVDKSKLQTLSLQELCDWVQSTEEGHYRPLKSAPNLRPGWRFPAPNDKAFEAALQQLYPGAIPDLHASRETPGSTTCYRDYTNRQTGMYRVTAKLSDDEISSVIAACCDSRFCLKDRKWTINADEECESDSTSIPCLEPCAVLLELARKAMRIEQEAKLDAKFSKSELESIQAALETGTDQLVEREADFGDARNPRRNLLLKLKVDSLLTNIREQPES
jgi:hypothetical protein